MAQFANCRQCSRAKVPVVSGRLASHVNAQENPCTGSYSVARPNDIITDDLPGIPVATGEGKTPPPDLGYDVQPPLDENARPYPGLEPRGGDGLRIFDESTQQAEPVAPVELPASRVQRAVDGSLWVFVGGDDPVMVQEVAICGEVEGAGGIGPRRICVQRKGPHEHIWWPYTEPTQATVRGGETAAASPLYPSVQGEGVFQMAQPPQERPDLHERFADIGLRDRMRHEVVHALEQALAADGVEQGQPVAFTDVTLTKIAGIAVDAIIDWISR